MKQYKIATIVVSIVFGIVVIIMTATKNKALDIKELAAGTLCSVLFYIVFFEIPNRLRNRNKKEN